MLGLCSALFIPDRNCEEKLVRKPAVAQKNPVIAFEYMQKPGNTKEYTQVEISRDIHIAQLKTETS